MHDLLSYGVPIAAFIAIVGLIEGAWFLLGNSVGESRKVGLRLARIGAGGPDASLSPKPPGRLADLIDGRIPWLRSTLESARSGISPVQVVIASCVLVFSLFLLLSVVGFPGPLALAAALALGVGAPMLVLSGMANRRRKRFLQQLPQAVDLMARGLQAGYPVGNAMAVVANQMPDPIGAEFHIVIEEITYGLDRDAALKNLLVRFPLPELRMMVASLEVTRETGGNLAEVFLKLAEAIRAKAQLRKKIDAISAEGRMSFWVVSGLPFVVGGALLLLRPQFFSDVVHDPLFWPMMSASPILLIIGATIIWRMVNLKI